MPGNDWLHGFIKHHNLTKRITDNVKVARDEVNHEIINSYFDNLEQCLNDVPPSNIYNYDETNISDDPGAKLVIARRGRNCIERKTQHSKSSVSVMFAGNTAGEFLPPLVVYKSESIYKEWFRGGPLNTVYDCTKNGWFDSCTFEVWFFKQFLPSIEHLKGPIVLIGDNLGSHFSTSVIQECMARNIFFICLAPNATHLCQPLDVTVFRPAKVSWKDILETWRLESRCMITCRKQFFPPYCTN